MGVPAPGPDRRRAGGLRWLGDARDRGGAPRCWPISWRALSRGPAPRPSILTDDQAGADRAADRLAGPGLPAVRRLGARAAARRRGLRLHREQRAGSRARPARGAAGRRAGDRPGARRSWARLSPPAGRPGPGRARSPGRAARRVGADALLLGVHALPLVLLAARIDCGRAGCPRRPPPARHAGGRSHAAGSGAADRRRRGDPLRRRACSPPWWPCSPGPPCPLSPRPPGPLRAAAERERRQKVSRWLELHHLAAGDPQSWSAS